MVDTRTARATRELLTDDAPTAAVTNEGEAVECASRESSRAVGNVNASSGEATSSDNDALINAAFGSAGIVAAGVVHAASREAATGNAIDDAASGHAASRAAASRDAACGDTSLALSLKEEDIHSRISE
ncbi:hypothetical protein QAD02_021878 [Eretmocerus hayati]|uniref:Uncharacterized protein n=1 Tax=Eretmocerus hayati TaxID=131215 RepID=A0ACC2PRY2_9HYME|nr:hypothetical protein QAD02_021878 [Eretmocerus hayati]